MQKFAAKSSFLRNVLNRMNGFEVEEDRFKTKKTFIAILKGFGGQKVKRLAALKSQNIGVREIIKI